jgi:hypothetical protein
MISPSFFSNSQMEEIRFKFPLINYSFNSVNLHKPQTPRFLQIVEINIAFMYHIVYSWIFQTINYSAFVGYDDKKGQIESS